MKRRLLASILSLIMVISLLPTAALADDAEPLVSLDLSSGSIVISATGYTQDNAEAETPHTGDYAITGTTTTNTITVTGGDHTITLNGVNVDLSAATEGIPCALAIEGGNVTLALADNSENTLKSGLIDNGSAGISCAGIWVAQGASLTITGNTGELTVVGGGTGSHGFANSAKAAGIGASRVYGTGYDAKYNTVGDITINGGIIEATGSAATNYGGPGIGGGTNDSNITINGGTVTAKAGYLNGRGVAGIGGAYNQNGKKNIKITGGRVDATGGSAGIGGGAYQGAGVILITDGTVTATSKSAGAGIGGGGGDYSGDYMGSTGSITITGGAVTANGSKYGAGIGGGGCQMQQANNAGAQASGNITISGGVVTATGGQYAPGIGSGAVVNTNGKTSAAESGQMGKIVISGGSITATNGSDFVTSNEATGKSYKVLDDSSTATVDSGIGQGMNASEASQSAFETWTPTDGEGNAILAVKRFNSSSVTYTRNGGDNVTVTGASGSTTLYLPEGYYTFDSGATPVLIATAANKQRADELVTTLKSINKDNDFAQQVIAAETIYNTFSESLRYYTDQQAGQGNTIADLKKDLQTANVKVTVKFDLAYTGASAKADAEVTYYSETDLGVPTRPNYSFVGWYRNDEQITDETGKVEHYPFLSETTLTAHWVSEVKGTGTEANPYQIVSGSNMVALSRISMNIATADDYAVFGKDASTASRSALLAASYRIENDITLNTSDGFYGIGGYIYYSSGASADWRNYFCGTFDGQNHTINLNIDTTALVSGEGSGDDDSTLMGHVKLNDATHVEVTGGVFNAASNCTIKNVKTTGTVTLATKKGSAAALVGTISNSSANFGGTNKSVIENCINEANVTVGAVFNVSTAAGILGIASGGSITIKNCENTGTITAGKALTIQDGKTTASQGNSLAGGIVGIISTTGTVENCTNTRDILAVRATELGQRSSRAGGICAQINHASVTVTGCTNSGNVASEAESNNAAGGIVGTTISTQPMTNCSNSGAIYAKGGHAGAIFGAQTSAGSQTCELVSCTHVLTADTAAAGWKLSTDDSVKVANGKLVVPVTDEASNFFDASHFVKNGDTKAADLFSADGSQLYNDLTHNDNLAESAYPFQTEDDAYVISNAQQYTDLVKAIQGDETAQNAVLGNRLYGADAAAKAVALASAYVKLSSDLTFSDVDAIGLGTAAIPFSGTIDGQGHTVNYDIDVEELGKTQNMTIGLVGVSASATVKNVNFAGSMTIATAADNDKPLSIGSAVADGGHTTVENCHSTVVISAESKCTVNQATMGMVYAGGLVGIQSAGAAVRNSSHKGNITVTAPKNPFAGGIAASYAGTMENVTALGDITANEKYITGVAQFGENAYAGGIAGQMNGTLTNAVAAGVITATNDCTLTSRYAYAGGLVGNSSSGLTTNGSKALTTVKTTVSGSATARNGAMLGNGTNAVSGDSWYVKAASSDATVVGAKAIDTTVLTSKTYGDTARMEVPEGVTMVSDLATLNGSTVSFIKAGENGEVKLAYNGQTFYTASITVTQKTLAADDVIITGVNSAYTSDEAAESAMDSINVIYNGEELVKGTDYTVAQDETSHKFTITFNGNYVGSVEKTYEVQSEAFDVTAAGYTGTYDGVDHSITVNAPDGAATVMYGETDGTYNQNSIAKKAAGTYIIYWQATKDSKTVTGSAVISIAKAALTIKADDKSMYVNAKKPDFTYTVDGLVNGETLTTQLTCTADGKTVGTFDIVPSGAVVSSSNDNYEISYVNGKLTVRYPYAPVIPGSSVTVPATSNGSVTVSPSTASKGTTVTVTTKPNEGYELGSLEVLDKNGNALALKDLGNGKYSFTMPDGKVTVNASFVKASVSTGFADVPANAYYADAVKWAVDKGVTNGLSDTLFGPYEPCTRAQIVTFLWRAAGSPEPKATTSKMTDLDPNAYYYKAVLWAVENGITSGMTDTTFVPNATCTRGQSVTFLYRALGKKASSSASFSDVAANAFYADAVNWAVENNVTNGTSATTFSPNADCTRAEIVTFLYRAYQGK